MSEPIEADLHGDIAYLVTKSISLFRETASASSLETSSASAVAARLSKFKVWAAHLGAHRPTGHRSLTYRLRDTPDIRSHVESLLQDLLRAIFDLRAADIIEDAKPESTPTKEIWTEEDSELERFLRVDSLINQSEWEGALSEIDHVIGCLMRLSVTLRNPKSLDRYGEHRDAALESQFIQFATKHFSEKYPRADPKVWTSLGVASARRRAYFKYREEHARLLAEDLSDHGSDLEFEGKEATTIASSVPPHLKGKGTSIDQDDGSEASATSYATTLADGSTPCVPPLPAEALDGPFNCPFCQTMISIDSHSAWKKHVFRDLKPYVCLALNCPTPYTLYEKRSHWRKHMREMHWKSHSCPYGCSMPFPSTPEALHDHISSSHDRSISADILKSLHNAGSGCNSSQVMGDCPLCIEVKIQSAEHYVKHVGQHLELLALFSLPDRRSEDEQTSDNSAIAQSDSQGEYSHNASDAADGYHITTTHADENNQIATATQTKDDWSTAAYESLTPHPEVSPEETHNQRDYHDYQFGLDPPSHATEANYATYSYTPSANTSGNEDLYNISRELPYNTRSTDTNSIRGEYAIHPDSAFQPGRILKMPWSEPRGTKDVELMSEAHDDILVYTGIRRFIIIATTQGHSTCIPILTYEGKGCTKRGVKAAKHGIIHTLENQPQILKNEPELGFGPVRAVMEESETLAVASRVNYSKSFTIEHNVLVIFIGKIHPNDFRAVQRNQNHCWERMSREPGGSSSRRYRRH